MAIPTGQPNTEPQEPLQEPRTAAPKASNGPQSDKALGEQESGPQRHGDKQKRTSYSDSCIPIKQGLQVSIPSLQKETWSYQAHTP